MGYLSAVDMLNHANRNVALRWHLQSNHYPPIPDCMLPVVRRAISYAARGKWETLLTLPEGVSHKKHGKRAPVWEVVKHAHLDAFITAERVRLGLEPGGEE